MRQKPNTDVEKIYHTVHTALDNMHHSFKEFQALFKKVGSTIEEAETQYTIIKEAFELFKAKNGSITVLQNETLHDTNISTVDVYPIESKSTDDTAPKLEKNDQLLQKNPVLQSDVIHILETNLPRNISNNEVEVLQQNPACQSNISLSESEKSFIQDKQLINATVTVDPHLSGAVSKISNNSVEYQSISATLNKSNVEKKDTSTNVKEISSSKNTKIFSRDEGTKKNVPRVTKDTKIDSVHTPFDHREREVEESESPSVISQKGIGAKVIFSETENLLSAQHSSSLVPQNDNITKVDCGETKNLSSIQQSLPSTSPSPPSRNIEGSKSGEETTTFHSSIPLPFPRPRNRDDKMFLPKKTPSPSRQRSLLQQKERLHPYELQHHTQNFLECRTPSMGSNFPVPKLKDVNHQEHGKGKGKKGQERYNERNNIFTSLCVQMSSPEMQTIRKSIPPVGLQYIFPTGKNAIELYHALTRGEKLYDTLVATKQEDDNNVMNPHMENLNNNKLCRDETVTVHKSASHHSNLTRATHNKGESLDNESLYRTCTESAPEGFHTVHHDQLQRKQVRILQSFDQINILENECSRNRNDRNSRERCKDSDIKSNKSLSEKSSVSACHRSIQDLLRVTNSIVHLPGDLKNIENKEDKTKEIIIQDDSSESCDIDDVIARQGILSIASSDPFPAIEKESSEGEKKILVVGPLDLHNRRNDAHGTSPIFQNETTPFSNSTLTLTEPLSNINGAGLLLQPTDDRQNPSQKRMCENEQLEMSFEKMTAPVHEKFSEDTNLHDDVKSNSSESLSFGDEITKLCEKREDKNPGTDLVEECKSNSSESVSLGQGIAQLCSRKTRKGTSISESSESYDLGAGIEKLCEKKDDQRHDNSNSVSSESISMGEGINRLCLENLPKEGWVSEPAEPSPSSIIRQDIMQNVRTPRNVGGISQLLQLHAHKHSHNIDSTTTPRSECDVPSSYPVRHSIFRNDENIDYKFNVFESEGNLKNVPTNLLSSDEVEKNSFLDQWVNKPIRSEVKDKSLLQNIISVPRKENVDPTSNNQHRGRTSQSTFLEKDKKREREDDTLSPKKRHKASKVNDDIGKGKGKKMEEEKNNGKGKEQFHGKNKTNKGKDQLHGKMNKGKGKKNNHKNDTQQNENDYQKKDNKMKGKGKKKGEKFNKELSSKSTNKKTEWLNRMYGQDANLDAMPRSSNRQRNSIKDTGPISDTEFLANVKIRPRKK